MDIAYYISDLLGQQGELSVPNLGYFAQVRKSAYYDEMAKKFFPPQYVVQYDPQVIEGDDSLAEYITRLKKISIASSRYFIDKYITGLKTQVVVEDIPFADLGKFSSDGVKLTFHPGAKTNAPQFFAFPPIAVNRLHGEPPEVKPTSINKQDQFAIPTAIPEPTFKPAPVYTPETLPAREPAPAPTPGFKSNPLFGTEAEPKPIYNQPQPVYVPEHVQEEEITPYMNIWTIVLIAITVLAIAFVILYKFKPGPFKEWFGGDKETAKSGSMVVKRDSVTHDTSIKDAVVHTDSTSTVKVDTIKPAVTETPKEAAAPITTAPPLATTSGSAMPAVIPRGQWIVYAGTFPIRSLADNSIKNYKAMGYEQARLLKENVKVGNNYKVILGAYPTKAEADAAGKEILMAHSNIALSIEKY